MKKTLLMMIGMALSPAAFAGGGLIGSGGDGLVLSPSGPSVQDVTVPLPGGIGKYGTLKVVGTPGKGQDELFAYFPCDLTDDGVPYRFACTGGFGAKLNEAVQLSPGYYIVRYSDSQMPGFVQIKPGEAATIHLQKIRVPGANTLMTYSVFRDLRDEGERDKMLRYVFYTQESGAKVFADLACELHEWEACDALRGDDYKALKRAVVHFDEEEATVSLPYVINGRIVKWDRYSRVYNQYQAEDKFVSVLPGVYGIEFTDTKTGETSVQYGIRVD